MTDVTEDIQVHHSSDRGVTFQEHIVAVPSILGDTAVAFGSRGTAHIVYNDYYGRPSVGISYVYSTKSPYTNWSAPIPLHDGFSATSYYSPALTISACGSSTSVLHAVWVDDRAGAGKYNVYYTRKVAKTGEPWSSNLRFSGTDLPPNIYGSGDGLTAAIAAGSGTAVGVWGKAGNYDSPLPVRASRIAPGVSCP